MTPYQDARLIRNHHTYKQAIANIMSVSAHIDALASLETKDLQRIKRAEQRLHGYKITAIQTLAENHRLQAEILEDYLTMDNIEIPDTLPEGGL